MADAGIDMSESNVEKKKCVPVLFLPVELRGELGSSEVIVTQNWDVRARELSAPPPSHGAVAVHHSPRDESFFPFLSCRRNVSRVGGGGEEASRVSSYCLNAHTQLRTPHGTGSHQGHD
jgi:hypothetical protein